MSKLSEKDKLRILTNKRLDLTADENAYLGGAFGQDQYQDDITDYVEVLVHDMEENLLESNIVNFDEIENDNYTIKLKTGTILRRLGYDRGKFIVKYNFLRQTAGSYETMLVDTNGEIYTGEFDPNNPADVNRIDNDLFLKENKYLIHSISPDRTEIRLLPQNIANEKYLRDFYNLSKTYKKVQSSPELGGFVEFVETLDSAGQPNAKKLSKKIKFIQGTDETFQKQMIGGTFSIPNFFHVKTIPPTFNPTLLGTDIVTKVERFNPDQIQASFTLAEESYQHVIPNANNFLSTTFDRIYEHFKGTDGEGYDWDDEIPTSATYRSGNGYNSDAAIKYVRDVVMRRVVDLSDFHFNQPKFKRPSDDNPYNIILESNSILPADESCTYTWEVHGWQKDDSGDQIDELIPRVAGETSGNDFSIMTIDDSLEFKYAVKSNTDPKVATITYLAVDEVERPRMRFAIQLHTRDIALGVKLTVTSNLIERNSFIVLPAVLETARN